MAAFAAAGTASNPGPATAKPAPPVPAALTPDARQVSDAIEVLAAFVGTFEADRYSGADVAHLASEFTRGERLCAAGKTVAAARAAAANCHQASGERSPAHWLAGVTGESLGNAMGVLRLGEAMREHAGVDDAYRAGRLSSSGAKAVAGALAVNPASEDELLEAAEQATLRQLRERCERAKAAGRTEEDANAAYDRIRASRHCRTWTDTDGAFRLDARLTPDAGASLLASLTAEADRQFDLARTMGRDEPTEAYAADALVALVTGQGLLRDLDFPSASGCGQGIDPKAMVLVRVDLGALRRGTVVGGELCEIAGVGPVPVATARSLMGDAITDLVIQDGVDVTTICHLGRSIPAALKTALIARDPTCVVPNCDVATGLEFDHWSVPFAEGGAASLENIARLCRHHHYLRTHKGFELSGGPGSWRWSPPAGCSDKDPPFG
jgi:hypothetical protein